MNNHAIRILHFLLIIVQIYWYRQKTKCNLWVKVRWSTLGKFDLGQNCQFKSPRKFNPQGKWVHLSWSNIIDLVITESFVRIALLRWNSDDLCNFLLQIFLFMGSTWRKKNWRTILVNTFSTTLIRENNDVLELHVG